MLGRLLLSSFYRAKLQQLICPIFHKWMKRSVIRNT